MALSMWTDLANQYGEKFGLPPALILALIDMESGGDPNAVNPVSNATGLLQVTSPVLQDYNRIHKLNWTLEDCKDPDTNIQIGAELLKKIALTYEKYNRLKPQWSNENYAGVVIFGWNAGYSSTGGVSYVLSRLSSKGIGKDRWNVDLIQQASANLSNASGYLRDPARAAWAKRVAQKYLGIEGAAAKRVAASNGQTSKDGSWSTGKKVAVFGGVALVAGIGYMIFKEDTEEKAHSYGELAGIPQIHIHNHR